MMMSELNYFLTIYYLLKFNYENKFKLNGILWLKRGNYFNIQLIQN